MGIPRPHDPYELTAPPAWPEVDEDALGTYAHAFERVSSSVGSLLGEAQRERSQLFGGAGIWSGIAAVAARGDLDRRILDLESVKENLDSAAKLFSDGASVTATAKTAITNTVEIANRILDWIPYAQRHT